MTEKVVVTQEQFDWLEKYKTEQQIDYAIDLQLHQKRPDSPIADWKVSEVARALYDGYEVETKFEVGDWVGKSDYQEFKCNGRRLDVVKVVRRTFGGTLFIELEGTDGVFSSGYLRRATPEEIAKEKERLWWEKIRREVGEFKCNDVLIDKFGRAHQTFEVDPKELYESGELKGFYPAESFVKFGGDDE